MIGARDSRLGLLLVIGVAVGVSIVGCNREPATSPVSSSPAHAASSQSAVDANQSADSVTHLDSDSFDDALKPVGVNSGGDLDSGDEVEHAEIVDHQTTDTSTDHSENDSSDESVTDPPDNKIKNEIQATDNSEDPLTDHAMGDQAAPVLPASRVLLPTTAGLLFIDVEVWIGDQTLGESFQQRIAEVMQDALGDGEALTWELIFAHVATEPETFGRNQMMNEDQYQNMIQRYDMNRNRQPEIDEVARFLFRGNGVAVPFRLQGTDYFRYDNRESSKLFVALDRNGDRQLDADEISRVGEILRSMDDNSDQRIDLGEAEIDQPDNDPAWNRRRTNRRGEVAMDLEGFIDWTMVSYSVDGLLKDSALGFSSPAVAKIDVDANDSISSAEAKLLSEVDPDVRLRVKYSVSQSTPTVEILSQHGDVVSAADKELTDLISIDGTSLRLWAMAKDTGSRGNQIPLEAFAMLDANSDGGLDEDEIPAAAADELSIEDLDADGDGKLSFQEINERADRYQPIWKNQIRARAAEFPDGVFGWLDVDHDFVLTEREILGAGSRLESVGTLPIRADQIPDSLAIQLVRGDPVLDAEHFRFQFRESNRDTSLPRWALEMDVNGDGEVSQPEFLGTAQQFSELDANGDGFIGPAEIKDE